MDDGFDFEWFLKGMYIYLLYACIGISVIYDRQEGKRSSRGVDSAFDPQAGVRATVARICFE